MGSVRAFYVDPMSYHNLAGYDYELLSNMNRDFELTFYANKKFHLEIPDIIIKKIYRYSDKKGAAKGVSYLLSQIQLLRDIKKHKPVLVHFQWLKLPLLDYFILRYIKKYAKVVYTSHDVFTHNDEEKNKSVFIKILQVVDAVIVHTNNSKQSLSQFINQNKIFIINHGLLNLSHYCSKGINIDEYKKSMGLDDGIIFSALGTMDQYKGTDLLLDAWQSSEILSASPKVKLLIAGKNKIGLKAADLKAGNILLIDRFIPDEEFNVLLQVSHLILLPYRRISQSGLLLSALAAQKKILVSRAGDLTEPFNEGKIGWILDETNAADLRKLLENIILESTSELLEPVDQKIWDRIKKTYDWESIALETSLLYKRCTGVNIKNEMKSILLHEQN